MSLWAYEVVFPPQRSKSNFESRLRVIACSRLFSFVSSYYTTNTMISLLEGTVAFKGDKFAVLNVGGVGYKVHLPPETLRGLPVAGSSVQVWTHLHVREDSLELYGFPSYAEMDFFETLISVSGVGPKSAIGILGVAPIDTLKRAIAAGETTYLTKVSGVGKRMAEKIIVELKDKLGASSVSDDTRAGLKEDADVLDALFAMGYSQREAREALGKVPQGIAGTQQRLQAAIKLLGK